MERLPATLRLQLSPADSRVVLRPANQRGGERVIRETSVAVPEGPWTLTASAPGHTERIATIQVGAGETQTVDLRLTRQTTVRAPQPIGMEGWEQPGKWTQSGSWLVQRGGDYALFGQSPTSGVFTFTATILRGGRLQWVVDYKDNRNYVLLQMDDDDYWRKIVENGRTRELFKAKHGVDKKQGYFTVSVDVTAHALTQKLYKNGTWGVLDSWTASDVDFTGGKFGFYIPGNDEIGLSNFTYTPRP